MLPGECRPTNDGAFGSRDTHGRRTHPAVGCASQMDSYQRYAIACSIRRPRTRWACNAQARLDRLKTRQAGFHAAYICMQTASGSWTPQISTPGSWRTISSTSRSLMHGWTAKARPASATSWKPRNWRCCAATPDALAPPVDMTTSGNDAELRVTADGLERSRQVLQGALGQRNAGSEARYGKNSTPSPMMR